jgi:hypothetical protein
VSEQWGHEQDDLTSAKRPAPRLTALEADVRHLYGRVGAIVRELSAYEAVLANTEPES